ADEGGRVRAEHGRQGDEPADRRSARRGRREERPGETRHAALRSRGVGAARADDAGLAGARDRRRPALAVPDLRGGAVGRAPAASETAGALKARDLPRHVCCETQRPNVRYFVLNAARSAFSSPRQVLAAETVASCCASAAAFALAETHCPNAFASGA